MAATAPVPGDDERARSAYTDARAFLAAGDDRAAIATLEAAVATPGPHRGRLLALLGDALRLAGRHDEARRAYEQAIEEGGAAAEAAAVDRATLLEDALGDATGARAAWDRYLQRHPDGSDAARALLARARLAAGAGDHAAAEADLRRLLTDHPAAPEASHALVRLGERLLRTGDWDAAAALFGPHVNASGALGEAALAGLIRVRIGQGRAAEAQRLSDRHRDRFPDGAHRAAIDAALERLEEEAGP